VRPGTAGAGHRKAGRGDHRGEQEGALADETTIASATSEPIWMWKPKPGQGSRN
jgi:hypothetical protein